MKLCVKQINIFLVCFIVLAFVGSARADTPAYGPDNIKITSFGFSDITLSWSSVGSDPVLTGYRIERESPVGGGFTPIVLNTGSIATTYTDTGLSSGVTYSYRVAGINASGTGPYSSYTISATTLAPANFPPPGRPQNLKAVAFSGSAIDLTWSAPSSSQPVTGYKIERGSGESFSIIVSNTNSILTSFRDPSLSSGVTYSYRVSAINAYGTGEPSFAVYAETLIIPGAPRNVSVRSGDKEVFISWTEPVFNGGIVSSYVISGGPTSTVVSASSTSAVISGLTNGTAYYFSVSAKNGAGESLPTRASTVVPLATMAAVSYGPSVVTTVTSTATAVDAVLSPSASDLADQIKVLQALLDSLKSQVPQASTPVSPSVAPRVTPIVTPNEGTESASSKNFARNLYAGLSGDDVRDLQLILISQNSGQAGDALQAIGATGYFGSLTKDALAEFQASVGIEPAAGYFGPKTRAYLGY